jgi:hypothetical protein
MGRVAGLASKAGSFDRFPAQLGGAGLCPAGSAGARGWGHLPLTFQLLRNRGLFAMTDGPWLSGGRRTAPSGSAPAAAACRTAERNLPGSKGTV